MQEGLGDTSKQKFYHEERGPETAVLVGLITPQQNERKTQEYLDELEFLATTAGAVTVKRFTQRMNGPSSVTYLGIGKLQEIRAYIQAEEDQEREISMVIFDDELSAKQLRNIEAYSKSRFSTAPVSFSTSSPCEPKRPTPRRRSNWHSTATCFPVCNAFGRTSNAKEAVQEVEEAKAL